LNIRNYRHKRAVVYYTEKVKAMKKILLIIVILIAIPSCSVEDDINPQTTTVAISAGNEFITSTTGKNVQRGSMFAWISEMQIKATHTSGYVSTTDFTLVANGTSGAGNKFIMDNVMIGNNTFTASSKTTEPERLETAQVSRSEAFTTTMSALNSRNPYALYTSTAPVNFTIIQDAAQNVNIPMRTVNSRFIALFNIDDFNLNSYTVTCYVNGVKFGPTTTCNWFRNANFYWSDSNSIAGKSIYFKIVGGNDTFTTASKVLIASNTAKIRYTIKDNSLITTPM
jgi:hypothetical protein